MKKKIVICMNCHGMYIKNIMTKYCSEITKNYNIHYISYAKKITLKQNTFDDNESKLIKDADILIIQYIKNDRGMLNHDYIISIALTKNIFIIPHYVFSGYFYDENIFNNIIETCKSKKDIDYILENVKFDKKKCTDFVNSELEYIKKIDIHNNINNMYNFVKNNYKNTKLFQNRGHPNMLFFIEIVNGILEKLKLKKIKNVNDNTSFHLNQKCIIFDETKNILDLNFDTQLSNSIYLSINQYFYILLYKEVFDNNKSEKLDYLFRNIDDKHRKKPAFFNFIDDNLLKNIIEIIS